MNKISSILLYYILFYNYIIHAQQINNSYPWAENYSRSNSIEQRIKPPPGYHRAEVVAGNFACWLRGLPLKSDEAPVLDYLGRTTLNSNDTTLAFVVDYPIYGKKLEQCMDILYRWYAEYLLAHKRGKKINFYMPGGYILSWNDWKKGLRPDYKGLNFKLRKTAEPDSSRSVFEEYVREIFYYSFTQTAYFAYPTIKIDNLQIGDFIVKKGSKGHAVMIMDMVIDENGNKLVIVGHGGTPAREFHFLYYKRNNPWFPIDANRDYIDLPIKKKMTWDGLRRFPQ